MNRREFAKVAVTGAAGLSVSPAILTGKGWKGANDRVNIAVIGIRSQGQLHIAGYSASKNARVTAICEVDSNLVSERVKTHFTEKGKKYRIRRDDNTGEEVVSGEELQNGLPLKLKKNDSMKMTIEKV